MNADLTEHRSCDRFIADESIAGSFGAAGVSVLNVAEHGIQLEHAQPLRIGTVARLWFHRRDVAVSVNALVVWSRLSQRPNDEGKFLYHSGVHIEDDTTQFADALQTLVKRGVIHRDADALARKKQLLAEKEKARAGRPIVKLIRSDDVPPDQALLIEHARERLRTHADEAKKWYNRARFLGADEAPLADTIRHREDVLAVWEYLERSVPLANIVRVFEKKS